MIKKTSATPTTTTPHIQFKGSHGKFVWMLLTAYWRGDEKKTAWALLIGVIALSTLTVHADVLINYWSNGFFEHLQKADWEGFIGALNIFPALVIYILFGFLGSLYLNAQLTIRWRRWMTEHFLEKWLKDNRFFKLRLQEETPDNPDQRIAQDLGSISAETLSLLISLYRSILQIFSFGIILWAIFGALEYTLKGYKIYIPGAMMWVAIIYAAFSTLIIWKVGSPLIALDFAQEKKEANFRYALMRLRERAPEAAMMTSKQQEELVYSERFSHVIQNFYNILRRRMIISTWMNILINTSTFFPLFIAAPKFFAGALTFGTLMQINNAFGTVERSFSFIIHHFNSIASWRASIDRVIEFDNRLEQAANLTQGIAVTEASLTSPLIVEALDLFTPGKKPLLQKLSFTAQPGQWTALKGPSGIGKSTLIQTIAGNWPFASGKISKPAGTWLYAPQKPYFSLLSLNQLLIPGLVDENIFRKGTSKGAAELSMSEESLSHISDIGKDLEKRAQKENKDRENILNLLKELDLSHLIPHLNDRLDWNNTLSLGEQQRLNLIRVMLRQPDWIILDEPTASMDIPLAQKAYKLLKKICKDASVLVISHGKEVDAFIDETIDVTPFATIERHKDKE